MASSSREWVTEPLASEGKPDVPPTEAVRTDEIHPEIAPSASPATAKVSSIEPAGVSVAIEGVPRDTVIEAVEAVSLMTSSPLGITIAICKQFFLDIIILYFNKVLLQVFRLWVHQLRGNQRVFPGNSGKRQVLQLLWMLQSWTSCIATCLLTSLSLSVTLR